MALTQWREVLIILRNSYTNSQRYFRTITTKFMMCVVYEKQSLGEGQ